MKVKHLSQSEKALYKRFKNSSKELKLFKAGKIKLRGANELLKEL
jgi:hypothetical protein